MFTFFLGGPQYDITSLTLVRKVAQPQSSSTVRVIVQPHAIFRHGSYDRFVVEEKCGPAAAAAWPREITITGGAGDLDKSERAQFNNWKSGFTLPLIFG